MWEGTDLFEVDPNTGDVNGVAPYGFTVDPNTGDVVGTGTAPVGVGAGAPTSSSVDSWLGNLKGVGSTVLDAYKSYTGFQTARAAIDANAANVAAQNAAKASTLKFNSDLLGFSQQAERARAPASAARAQQDAASVIAGGGGLPLWLVLALAGGYLLLRK